jgi:hypothetical protein
MRKLHKLFKILKEILHWIFGFSIAIAFGIQAFIPLLYILYPYSVSIMFTYIILALLFPVLYLIFKKRVLKGISFGLFFLPVLLFLLLCIALETGYIRVC